MKKQNNKGFSFIEIIVIVAIIVVSASIIGGSLYTAYHARATQASRTVDGMISQSKINALSGKKNTLKLYYSSSDKCYKCGLYKEGETTPYEEQDIGNSSLHILAGGVDIMEAGTELSLTYNIDTGGVKSLKVGSTEILGSSTADTSATITMSFYSSSSITIYKTTGEHEFN